MKGQIMPCEMTAFLTMMLAERPMFGIGIMYPSPGIIERIGPDWDWVWIDGQHGNLGYHDIEAAVRACNLVSRPAVVRVPGSDAGVIGKALDTSADAVMVPMINTVEEARTAVSASKFPPLGSRSYGGRRVIDLDGRSYANRESVQPLLICQIETGEGLRNVKAIADIEGVDALFFGPDDMSLEAGLPMEKPRPEHYFSEALRKVAGAAAASKKIAGGVFTAPDAIREAVDLGYRLIVSSADVALLANGSKDKIREVRQSFEA